MELGFYGYASGIYAETLIKGSNEINLNVGIM